MNNATEFELREMPCAACGSDSRRHFGWRGGTAHHDGRGVRIEIVRCKACSHLYPHPMPFPSREIGNLYSDPDDYFEAHDVEDKKRSGQAMMKIFEGRLHRRGTILDVGCGRGELLWAAREAGWEFAGIDPSPAYLSWANEHLGIQGRLATIEEAEFPAEHFDAVVMGGVIEHLYTPFSTLQEVWRVLKPGGIFYFDAPNEDGLYMRIGNLYMRAQARDWVVNLAPTFPPYHVQGFNPASLRHLLKRVGFQVMEFSVAGTTSPPTGKTSLRKRVEYGGAQLVNWLGNRLGAGIYIYVWSEKPSQD